MILFSPFTVKYVTFFHRVQGSRELPAVLLFYVMRDVGLEMPSAERCRRLGGGEEGDLADGIWLLDQEGVKVILFSCLTT